MTRRTSACCENKVKVHLPYLVYQIGHQISRQILWSSLRTRRETNCKTFVFIMLIRSINVEMFLLRLSILVFSNGDVATFSDPSKSIATCIYIRADPTPVENVWIGTELILIQIQLIFRQLLFKWKSSFKTKSRIKNKIQSIYLVGIRVWLNFHDAHNQVQPKRRQINKVIKKEGRRNLGLKSAGKNNKHFTMSILLAKQPQKQYNCNMVHINMSLKVFKYFFFHY